MGVAGLPAGPPLGEERRGDFEDPGIDLEGLAGERKCPVWGHATRASRSRVLWPEGVGDLRRESDNEARKWP